MGRFSRSQNVSVCVKVFTLFTLLIANSLSVCKTVYKFLKVFTYLVANDLSVYINDNAKGSSAVFSLRMRRSVKRTTYLLPKGIFISF